MKKANIPWQDKPAGFNGPVWRHTENPIIGRNPFPGIARVFNSGVVPFEDGFIGVFRCENEEVLPFLRVGRSKDGVKWELEDKNIEFVNTDGEEFNPFYAYDPRVTELEGSYYVQWCTDFVGGPSIGLAKTDDFVTFERIENPFIPFNRNAVLFPEKINGKYALLSRPSDSGHTPFGDIYVSYSKDLEFWGQHRFVMGGGTKGWWQNLKIGGGPVPILTDEGWLLIYHGVTNTCNGYVYSMGVAILDKDEPSKVKYRASKYLLTPEEWYEERGFVPNVTFPCATLHDEETGRLAIYYGAADSYIALAYSTIDELIKFAKDNDEWIERDRKIGIR